jgi:ATP-dependent protease ClpP protease subunit
MTVPPYLRKEHQRLMPKALASGAKAGSWFDIRAAADDPTVAEVYVYDEIGGWGVLAADFVQALQALDADTINVRISSPGGSVFEALAIHASLRNISATVNCIVDGLCASAATVVAMAGDSITTAPGSMWMVHDAIGTVYGNAADMQGMADLLDKSSQNIADLYAARAGGKSDEWRTTMQAETWYTSDEAVSAGLADGLTESTKTPTARTPVVINKREPSGFVFDAELFRKAVKEAVA